jgi:hypothetical protein
MTIDWANFDSPSKPVNASVNQISAMFAQQNMLQPNLFAPSFAQPNFVVPSVQTSNPAPNLSQALSQPTSASSAQKEADKSAANNSDPFAGLFNDMPSTSNQTSAKPAGNTATSLQSTPNLFAPAVPANQNQINPMQQNLAFSNQAAMMPVNMNGMNTVPAMQQMQMPMYAGPNMNMANLTPQQLAALQQQMLYQQQAYFYQMQQMAAAQQQRGQGFQAQNAPNSANTQVPGSQMQIQQPGNPTFRPFG